MSTTASPPDIGLASLVGSLATRLKNMGTGPTAELRRLRADTEDRWRSTTFYRLYAETITPRHAGGDGHEQGWAMIVAGLTRLEHRSGRPFGETLAEHGFSERRLVRLLDADDDHLASELRATVSFLASKGTTANWIDLADLVLSNATERRDHVRRRIAAAYYRKLAKTSAAKA